jgi:hypothetical protein
MFATKDRKALHRSCYFNLGGPLRWLVKEPVGQHFSAPRGNDVDQFTAMQVNDSGGKHGGLDRTGASDGSLINLDRAGRHAELLLNQPGAVLATAGVSRDHRVTIAAYPPTRLFPSPLGPRRARRDRRMRLGPDLPLTLRMHTPTPGGQIPKPRLDGDDAAYPALRTPDNIQR